MPFSSRLAALRFQPVKGFEIPEALRSPTVFDVTWRDFRSVGESASLEPKFVGMRPMDVGKCAIVRSPALEPELRRRVEITRGS
jgi:hypothetical protein